MVVEALPAIIAARALGWRALTGATLFPGIGHRPRRPSDEVLGAARPADRGAQTGHPRDRLLHPRGEYRAAFGLLRGYTPLLILITAIVLIVTYANRSALAQERPVFRLGYSLGVAGAIGNFIDRLIFGRCH